MEAKFTKGEWKIDPEIQFNDWGTRETDIECGGKHLLTIYGDNEESEANAKLIAAAPEMYEALTELMMTIKSLPPLTAIAGTLEKEYKKAEAALKKATE